MQHIPTTATALETLKRLAKKLRKSSGAATSLAAALDAVARQHGYAHWKHVTECQQNTVNQSDKVRGLPKEMREYLTEALAENPPSAETQEAWGRGLVFALDVKAAQETGDIPDCVECDDAWLLAAGSLWPTLVCTPDEETGTSLLEVRSVDECLEIALDDMFNYTFFRYKGADRVTSLGLAKDRVFSHLFFPPMHVWIGGGYMGGLDETRIDGKLEYVRW